MSGRTRGIDWSTRGHVAIVAIVVKIQVEGSAPHDIGNDASQRPPCDDPITRRGPGTLRDYRAPHQLGVTPTKPEPQRPLVTDRPAYFHLGEVRPGRVRAMVPVIEVHVEGTVPRLLGELLRGPLHARPVGRGLDRANDPIRSQRLR